jgi:uncharacterized membrane protein
MKFLSALACFVLCLGVLLVSVNFAAYNRAFYDAQFAANDTAEAVGISPADLARVRDGMIAYFGGAADTLQIEVTFDGEPVPRAFYSADELSHMTDAKAVFTAVRVAAYTSLGVGAGLVLLCAAMHYRKSKEASIRESGNDPQAGRKKPRGLGYTLSFGACVGGGALLLIVALVGVVALIDFNAVFGAFHRLFFPQGNWQFAAEFSPMLRMLPESLFASAAGIIIGVGAGFALLMHVGGMVVFIKLKAKNVRV